MSDNWYTSKSMGKPRDQVALKYRGRNVKKGENSTKSVRTRKTEWSEQPQTLSVDFERLCVSDNEEETENGMINNE